MTIKGGIPMGGSCCGGSCSPRQFLTKDEKIEMLKQHHEHLTKEARGVEERLKALQES